jgi:tetrapyrrole methylase family protein/MazG family protein
MTNKLTIVGLGPGDPSLRTIAAQAALDRASRIILRTSVHPGIDDLVSDPRTTSCDDLYDAEPTFKALYQAIVARVIDGLDRGDVVYAVPGNPVAGEMTVIALRSAATTAGHEVEVVPGAGGLDVVAAVSGLDLMTDGVQTIDALELRAWHEATPFNGSILDISPVRPLVITQVYKKSVASAVKLALATAYPDDHEISVIGWDASQNVTSASLIPLHELDRVPVDHLTSVVVPPLDWRANTRSPSELFRIVARLRDEHGCPWDREQTHESIRSAVIEEAFEVVDAIDQGDMQALVDELGDLLIQVALHAQIATERGDFDATDVFHAISSKLIRRHPHVFGDAVADDPDAVIRTWESVKSSEPGKSDLGERAPIDKLPYSMPASLKIAELEAIEPGAVVDVERLGQEIAERMVRLARSGADIDAAVERAYRILDRRMSAASVSED